MSEEFKNCVMVPFMGTTQKEKEAFPSLEGLNNNEAAKVIIKQLQKIENGHIPGHLNCGDGIDSVDKLIKEIQTKTPEGLRVIELSRKLEQGIINQGNETLNWKDKFLAKIKGVLQEIF
ncbi:MAG: hypothetical protein UR27_C0021G0037 [Candidatus Peregrinibacteria bacterium GW2011_GWA2_33_10]|nr:MAG: hypothetical protein UR27_C0021G0037 [Candidatus Peregrinibacteria bacterium GW2011_GWA2_33_10]KKP40980.1 MAG: hypothetical protein UR30_C0002G0014 [Candidatus Peregrinibacteria bacterium GW2011_GWC2_33_13]OGJ48745.1 MAG: hypothetical protein A2229_01010 [Candidatus Peregrinibacteria bacterium RIFOXYA2_FULL_33_7]